MAGTSSNAATKIVAGLDLNATAPARRGRGTEYPVPADFIPSLVAMHKANKGVYTTEAISQEHAAALIRRARNWAKGDATRQVSTFAAEGKLASGAGDKRNNGTPKVRVGFSATAKPASVEVH